MAAVIFMLGELLLSLSGDVFEVRRESREGRKSCVWLGKVFYDLVVGVLKLLNE